MEHVLKYLCMDQCKPHTDQHIENAVCMGFFSQNIEEFSKAVLHGQCMKCLHDIGAQFFRDTPAVNVGRNMPKDIDSRLNQPFTPTPVF